VDVTRTRKYDEREPWWYAVPSSLVYPYATDTSIVAILTAEAQLKDIVQNLYNLIVQSYDHRGTQTQEAMKREMCVFSIYAWRIAANLACSQSLLQNLVKLSRTAPQVYVDIPPEVTNYVESSRNPDIFTREFVETVQRMNQMLKGRSDALQMLQEQIAWQLTNVIPELKDDVARAVESSGGKVSAS
jgi:mediator of RNA polymerase II transcription subunit 10